MAREYHYFNYMYLKYEEYIGLTHRGMESGTLPFDKGGFLCREEFL